jgi:Tol biopolymer transport system component/predicted Ser/Thr protein kinase
VSDLKTGDRLGAYEVLALLGRGGMGSVYRALDTRLQRPVAIKTIAEEFGERFQREARAISSLNHPNICTLYDVGPNYLVMELIEGDTLAERLRAGPLPVERAVEYAAQITRALAAAHARGIVHRDLKPANIMVTRSGVKVLDFGVARVGVIAGETATMSRAIVGTPAYMAPEQLQGEPGDARSDVFSFGLVFAEMLTGTRPSHGTLRFPPHVPPRLARVVERCLSSDPDERWQAAADVAWELTAIEPAPSRPRKSRERWVWAAAVAILATVVIAQRFFQSPTIERPPIRFTVPPPSAGRFDADLGAVFPSVSPDGRAVTFPATVDGQTRLWLKLLDAESARPLTGTEGIAGGAFWSPDSHSLAFFAEGKLKRIDVAGGPPQVLCSVSLNAHAGSWNSNGILLFGDGTAGPPGGIYSVSARGGEVRNVGKPDPSKDEDSVFWPGFLPDGDRFLYMAGVKGFKGNRIYIGSLGSPKTTFLMQANSRVLYSPPGFLLYVRDRTLLAQRFDYQSSRLIDEISPIAERIDYFAPIGIASMSVSSTGVLVYHAAERSSRLVWATRAGAETAAVSSVADFTTVRLSPDGQRLATDVTDTHTSANDIHLFDLIRQTDTRLTSAPGAEFAPLWSPDGRRIVFTWDKDAPPHLHQMALADGTVEALLPPSGELQTPDDWHPDGSLIIYDAAVPATKTDLWTLRTSGERKPTPFLQTAFNESGARFSPDGRWVAYVSDETGRNEIYARPFPGPGEARRISTSGGTLPRWRRDGKELFYVEGERLMAVPTTFSPSLATGAPVALLDRRPARIIDFDVARDGGSFLINSEVTGPGNTPLNVIVNWTSTLKKP